MDNTLGKEIVKANLTADALALAVHWVYDANKIKEVFLKTPQLLELPQDSYHKNAKKGDFTHYGEQVLILLSSVIENKGFNEEDWAEKWQKYFKTNTKKVYIDKATKATLESLEKGEKFYETSSSSNDLAPFARSAPLYLNFNKKLTEDEVAKNVVRQARLTTEVKPVLELCNFFARLIFSLQTEKDLPKVLNNLKKYLTNIELVQLYDKATQSVSEETIGVLSAMQTSCNYLHLFPNIIHIILKYYNKPYEAIINSIVAGGDNASRTAIVAMVLTAYHGDCSFMPSKWSEEINQRVEIDTLLAKI